MKEKVNWIIICQIITGIVVLSLLLAIGWACYLSSHHRLDSLEEAQAVAASQQETPRHRCADLPPTYDEATRTQPNLRHRNSRDTNLSSDNVENNRDTVQTNSEQASCSQNQSGSSSKNSNGHQSQPERGSDAKSVSENESLCVVYVDKIERQTIVTHYEFSENKPKLVEGGQYEQYDAGKEPNTGKISCGTRGYKDCRNIINYGASCSTAQDFSEDDINVIENVGECDNEKESGDKNEDRHEKCEDNVSSIADSEVESVGQYCSADDVSISSKYDTASGGSGVTME